MQKYLKYSFLIGLLFIVGCTNTLDYNDDDVAAIVKGEEITIGHLRFLYPDKNVLERIEGTVKAKLVVQEAKLLNLDVTEEINQEIELREKIPSEDTDNPTLKSIREFAETQAKKLGMKPEEYHKKYVEITAELMVYMNAYIKEMVEEPEVDEAGVDAYNEKVNRLLNELVKENEDEIEILIK